MFSLFFLTVQPDRFLTCTDGQFLWLFTQGWLAAPLTLTCPLVFSCARGTPILAGGIGVARFVAGSVFCVVCLLGQDFVSAFACNATGLDAVQRLEQKKLGDMDCHFAGQAWHFVTSTSTTNISFRHISLRQK